MNVPMSDPTQLKPMATRQMATYTHPVTPAHTNERPQKHPREGFPSIGHGGLFMENIPKPFQLYLWTTGLEILFHYCHIIQTLSQTQPLPGGKKKLQKVSEGRPDSNRAQRGGVSFP